MPQGAIPFPFGHCRICNDKATGVHYGVATCEGCKGFFKRSLPKADKYKCFFGGQCQLSPQNRNRCKACRFKKCMEMGMSVDAVKMGRIPKVDKERALEETKVLNSGIKTESNVDVPSSRAYIPSGRMYNSMGNSSPQNSHGQQSGSGDHNTSSYMRDLMDDHVAGEPISQRNNPSYHQALHSNLPQANNTNNQHIQPVPYQDGRTSNPDSGFSDSNHSDPESPHKQEPSFSYERMDNSDQHQSRRSVSSGEFEGEKEVLHAFANMSSSDERMQKNRTTEELPPLKGLSPPIPLHIPLSGINTTDSNSFIPPLDSVHNLMNRSRHNSGSIEGNKTVEPLRRSNSQSSLSSPRPNSGSVLYSPGVMKELFSQMMETGTNISSNNPWSNPLVQEAISSFTEQKNHMQHIMQSGFNDFKCLEAESKNKVQQPIKRRYSDMDNPHENSDFNYMAAFPPDAKVPAGEFNGYTFRRGPLSMVKQEIMENTFSHQISDERAPSNFHRKFHSEYPTSNDNNTMSSFGDNRCTSGLSNPFPFNTVIKTEKDKFGFPDCDPENILYDQRQIVSDINMPLAQCHYDSSNNCLQNTEHSQMLKNDSLFQEEKKRQDKLHTSSSTHISPSLSSVSSGGELNGSEALLTRQQQQSDFAMAAELDKDLDETLDSLNKNSESADGRDTLTDLAMMLSTLNKMKESQDLQCVQTREFIQMMNDELAGKKEIHELNKLEQATYSQVKVVWKALFEGIPVMNKIIISICQDFPGFTKLGAEDQAIMLEEAYFDIWLIIHAELFRNGETYIRLNNGACYSRFWMKHFLPNTLIQAMHRFSEELNQCKLSRLELNILCAIQLTDPDRPNINSKEEIRLLHSHYLDVLAYVIEKSQPTKHGRILIDLFRIMPMLRDIQIEQAQVIGSFRPDKPPERCESLVVPGSMEGEEIEESKIEGAVKDEGQKSLCEGQVNGEKQTPELLQATDCISSSN